METSQPNRQPSELPQPQPQQQDQQQRQHGHDDQPSHGAHAPPLLAHLPLPPANLPLRTAHSTPMTSPGLFSPTASRHNVAFPPTSVSESSTPAPRETPNAPYLHPLQSHRVRETHKALIDSDNITGRKLINQYEVIEEIGRGMHGKVKLARNLESGDNVAIKIIPRFSKKRRLGKVTAMDPQDKTKKEIAILKKIRHPNVVALLEVIDDPELKKIYMVLEHVELGEIVWRKKGLPHICQYERRRVEREVRGEPPSAEEEKYEQLLERRQALKDLKRAKMAQHYPGASDYWSVEHGAADEHSSGGQSRVPSKDDFGVSSDSQPGSRKSSRAPSRNQSFLSGDAPSELDEDVDWEDDLETPGPLRSNPNSTTALEGTMYGAYLDDTHAFRGRSPSMADSIISHMSSIDYNYQAHDAFTDDYSYVPCFTIDQARSTFRDTVLGLEYLHYQGVVHRDIKPANLLWTREHRVKISDFGVSYFGRPIRDGEPDDTVSESEARDFVDDDLELAKTVGTPAFFAPELCYTDLDKEQPKVSEQIDVWSLGVTLYCLIYARIPFLAEDEFQMFRRIATEDVYIPRRRLKPVDPSTSPSASSLYKRQNTFPYRDDNDLEYEDVDNLLFDLLRLMLVKNPDKRIRLRDIKRHPWVVHGISNPIGWLDDTDPARPSSGRRIQVDERDLSAAVVPITLLERARSVARKVVGKVMQPLVERGDSRSRRRATSSAASSAGESMFNNVPTTPHQRTDRRRSLLPDDYFANAVKDSYVGQEASIAPPENLEIEEVAYDPLATVLPLPTMPREPSSLETSEPPQEDAPGSSLWPFHRHTHSHGKLSAHLWNPMFSGSHTSPTTPSHENDRPYRRVNDVSRVARYLVPDKEDTSRSRSVDRGLFANSDKRAQAQVSISTAVAPGSIQAPARYGEQAMAGRAHGLASPLPLSPQRASSGVGTYQNSQPHSDPNFQQRIHVEMSERPRTAHRVETVPDAKPPPPRNYNTSTPESFARAKAAQFRKQEQEFVRAKQSLSGMDPVNVACPPSPDDGNWPQHPGGPSRGETMTTAKSSSTESMEGIGTPLTSPSEMTSPVSTFPGAKTASEAMLVFRSDPSLPALLSGASSVSADIEGELLGHPGVVSTQPSLLQTTDSLTPPAIAKEPTSGFPIDQVFENAPAMQSGTLAVPVGEAGDRSPGTGSTVSARLDTRRLSDEGYDDDDDDGSDDGILLMAKSKKKLTPTNTAPRGPPFEARRRDTNASTTSTETAKMVPVQGDSDHAEP